MRQNGETVNANLNLKEAAMIIGVSEPTMRRIIRRGEITYYRPSPRKIRFDVGDVLDYLNRRKVTAVA